MNGIQEVSGSIPLISTKGKSPQMLDKTGTCGLFFVLNSFAENTEKYCKKFCGCRTVAEWILASNCVRDTPQIIEMDVLIVPELLVAGVADERQLVLVRSGGPLHPALLTQGDNSLTECHVVHLLSSDYHRIRKQSRKNIPKWGILCLTMSHIGFIIISDNPFWNISKEVKA